MELAVLWHRCQILPKKRVNTSLLYRERDDPVKERLAKLANPIRDARDRERRDTQAHNTGGPANYLPHGKLIHILASLTHIIAHFRRSAMILSGIATVFC